MTDPVDLHAYVDGELSTEQKAGIRKLLDSSLIHAKEVEAISSLKSMLREKSESPEIGASWKSCVKRLDELDKAKKVDRIVSRWAPALCGAFFLCIVFGGLISRHNSATNQPVENLARFIGSTSKTASHWEKDLLNVSQLSTPKKLQIHPVVSGAIDGVPIKKYSARDASGDLQILLIGEHVDFEGMQSLPGYPAVRIGSYGAANCAAKIEGGETIVVIADRSYEDLANVLNEVAVK